MIKQISSLSNPLVKQITALETAHERRQTGLFTIEGLREIELACKAGYNMQTLLYCPQYTQPQHLQPIEPFLQNTELIETSAPVFEKLAYRKHIPNAIAIAATKPLLPNRLTLSANPLVVVIDNVEKPGNLGAILRTADAAAIDALLVCNPQTDVYNPNVIRASLGAVFTCPIAVCSAADAIAFLSSLHLAVYAAALTPQAVNYQILPLHNPCALLFGSEAYGLSPMWLQAAHAHAIIPMFGEVNSLNVSVSAGIFIYEALRQRQAMKEIAIKKQMEG